MQEYTRKPKIISRTLDRNLKESKQSSISEILQRYKKSFIGNVAAPCVPQQMLQRQREMKLISPKQLSSDRLDKGIRGNYSRANVIQGIMWYMSKDHARAIQILAQENKKPFKGTPPHGAFGTSSLTEDNEDAITLWGHTNMEGTIFGDYSPAELVDQLMRLGLQVSRHTTLNIISCSPNLTYDKTIETYAQQVKALLDLRLRRTIKVKTLPMIEIGRQSILYNFPAVKKIVYVSFPEGKVNEVEATIRIYDTYEKIITAWKSRYEVLEMKFSNILSCLVETREVKGKKPSRSPLSTPLLPNVFGEKGKGDM